MGRQGTIQITAERIDEILDECGFSVLRRKDPFDSFVIRYIKSKDPVDFLMEEMDKHIQKGEPFLVYEMYSR